VVEPTQVWEVEQDLAFSRVRDFVWSGVEQGWLEASGLWEAEEP